MKTRFLHCADIHLGYLQYGEKERYNDFAAALNAVIDKATGVYQPRRGGAVLPFDEHINGPVDFVVLAGDLFHKRAIDALTLNQAMHALRRLRQAGIPCIAVEGNHERTYYEESIGWMKFLALQDLIILLDAEMIDGRFDLKPWDPARRQGAYFEPKPGVRVYGLRYYGASTGAAINAFAEAIGAVDQTDIAYSVFVTHAGVEGQMDDKAGGVAFRQWAVLRDHIDYVALGHFHKPFILEDWIHNPGSPEACAISEAAWTPRGYLMVDVDLAQSFANGKHHVAVQGNPPRRAFRQFSFKTDHAHTPEALLAQITEFVTRQARDLTLAQRRSGAHETLPPVVELHLTGVLPFDRRALEMDAIERVLMEAFQPLVVQVKSFLQSADFAVEGEGASSRTELEQRVFAGLFARDARFAEARDGWTQAAMALKQMALGGASPDALLIELGAYIEQIDGDDGKILA